MDANTSAKLRQISDFEIRLLKVFQAVVECGGFAAAEAHLGIGRSTISVHIANLESRLNLKVCRRGRGGFALTDEGREVWELMNELFSSMELFRAGVNALQLELSGELKVVASDTICSQDESRIPEIINRFSKAAPDVQVQLDVRGMTDIEQMVLNDKAHVGFVHLNQEHATLDYNVLYENRCHLYCSSSHPLIRVPANELLDAINTSKLVYSGMKSSAEVAFQLADMTKAAMSYFYEARLAMIFSGAYIGFIPDFYAEKHVQQGRLKVLLPELKHYDLCVAAIVRNLGKENRARDKFMDIVMQCHQGAV